MVPLHRVYKNTYQYRTTILKVLKIITVKLLWFLVLLITSDAFFKNLITTKNIKPNNAKMQQPTKRIEGKLITAKKEIPRFPRSRGSRCVDERDPDTMVWAFTQERWRAWGESVKLMLKVQEIEEDLNIDKCYTFG